MSDRKPLFSWRHAIIQSDLPPTTRHLLLTLSVHMTDAGESCFPSTETLARETGLSKKAVIKHIRVARDSGWLRVGVAGLGRLSDNRQWKRHEYMVAFPIQERRSDEDENHEGGVPSSPASESAPGKPATTVATGAAEDGGERGSPASKTAEGGEPHSEGGEPEGKKAVNEVHPNATGNSTGNATGGSRAQGRAPTLPRETGETETRKPKPAKKKTAKGKRLVPEDFQPRPEDLDWAKVHVPLVGRDPEAVRIETERFINHHRAEGNRFADCYRAWRNWLLKAQDFARRDRAATGGGGKPRYLD
jgi:hypothetical protein